MRALLPLVLAGLGIAVAAQEPPRIDAVVIKRNSCGDCGMSAGPRPGGSYVLINGPLSSIFDNAYTSQSGEVIGMPDWFTTERFDLTVRIVGTPTPEQQRELWRGLFAERMKLVARTETKDYPTWDLVLARADGRLGPNLTRSAIVCGPGSDAAGSRPKPSNGAPACGLSVGAGTMRGAGLPLSMLTRNFRYPAERVVFDKTGLTGAWDVSLDFANVRATGGDVPDERPSFFTALQEQLGLKLVPSRNRLEFVVIDHIERPIVD